MQGRPALLLADTVYLRAAEEESIEYAAAVVAVESTLAFLALPQQFWDSKPLKVSHFLLTRTTSLLWVCALHDKDACLCVCMKAKAPIIHMLSQLVMQKTVGDCASAMVWLHEGCQKCRGAHKYVIDFPDTHRRIAGECTYWKGCMGVVKCCRVHPHPVRQICCSTSASPLIGRRCAACTPP